MNLNIACMPKLLNNSFTWLRLWSCTRLCWWNFKVKSKSVDATHWIRAWPLKVFVIKGGIEVYWKPHNQRRNHPKLQNCQKILSKPKTACKAVLWWWVERKRATRTHEEKLKNYIRYQTWKTVFLMKTKNQMLKNGKSANHNEHQNWKTEVFEHKSWKNRA